MVSTSKFIRFISLPQTPVFVVASLSNSTIRVDGEHANAQLKPEGALPYKTALYPSTSGHRDAR